jgi:cytochrome c553
MTGDVPMTAALRRMRFAVAAAVAIPALAAEPVDFVRDVRPILDAHCIRCHEGEGAESVFRLDVRAKALAGGDGHGVAIVPGKSAESNLVRFASGAAGVPRMPPADSGVAPVPAAAADLLARWIDAGATWPDGVDRVRLADPADHWAFRPVTVTSPPEVHQADWPAGDIDRFILARLEDAGLAPAAPADARTWLRRVTLDLTGLPPSPEEISAFVADPSPAARERAVDRLLASPRFGERQAQHWLDVVRFAETDGYEVNTERPHAWHYRDWVIGAFNRDLPFDRFVTDQLAGDATGADPATGFLVTAAVLLPGQIGADDVSQRAARQDALADILVNLGDALLGLSVGCARCHDHKSDPLPARDYYALQAFFAGVHYGDRELPSPAADRIGPVLRFARQRAAVAVDADDAERAAAAADVARLEGELAAARRFVYAGRFTEPEPTWLLHRGDAEQRGERLAPATPGLFAPTAGSVSLAADAPEQERRRALAAWLVRADHPLTARVIVNRIWQTHFGTGLVDTANDFGRSGTPPSHPQLLDWLAARLVADGWSLKAVHRRIALSATYGQASLVDDRALAVDAGCRLLWRFPPRRLEGEAIRDSILAVAGTLDLTAGGRGFDLFTTRGGLSGFPPIESFTGAGLRRMIYAHRIRMEKESVFGAFDCPDAGQTIGRRRQSTTPLQALALLNSPFTLDQSAALATRVGAETAGAADPTGAAVARAFALVLGRAPESDEANEARRLVADHGLPALARVLFNAGEFLFIP